MNLYSFIQPLYLSTRYDHPLDQTITHTSPTTWYVRWYAKGGIDCSACSSVTSIVQKYAGSIFMMGSDITTCTFHCTSENAKLSVNNTMSQQSVRQAGIDMHQDIQWFFNGFIERAPCSVFITWWTTFQERFPTFLPVRTEMILRSDACLQLVGTADMLLYDTLSTPDCLNLYLIDWKRTNNIETNKKLCILQLKMYKYLLETYYGIWTIDKCTFRTVKIIHMALVVFSEDLQDVKEYTIINNTDDDINNLLTYYVRDKNK